MDKKAKLHTTLSIKSDLDTVYRYLKRRYADEDYKRISEQVKGYMPEIKLVEDDGRSKLSFYVKGKDAFTELKVGGWKWGYELMETAGGTEIEIWYDWSSGMNLATIGTVKHQAANEVVETVLALKALESESKIQ